MRLHVVAVGKLKLPYAVAGCAEYAQRLRRMIPFEMTEVRDARRRKGGLVDRWRAEEAERLRAGLPPGGIFVALDERGRQWDSRGFAGWLADRRDRGVGTLSFVIGGPDGLDPPLRAEADRVWALGSLTMPHELARLVLLEQLYRGVSILQGSGYHRD